MKTKRNSSVSLVTVLGVLILSSVGVRLLEQLTTSWINYTSVTGGGLVSPHDLISGDTRTLTVAFIKLLLPGVLLQALLIKFGIQALSPARVSYVATVLILLLFQVGVALLEKLIAYQWAHASGLGTLTTTSGSTLFMAAIITAALVIFEAALITGICRPQVGRYPAVTFARG